MYTFSSLICEIVRRYHCLASRRTPENAFDSLGVERV